MDYQDESDREFEDGTPDEPKIDRQRRKALITGALLVPTIITLHATPAWAQTDYTSVAYKYGNHKGLCRNPDFDPNADPTADDATEHVLDEFVECEQGNDGNKKKKKKKNGSVPF